MRIYFTSTDQSTDRKWSLGLWTKGSWNNENITARCSRGLLFPANPYRPLLCHLLSGAVNAQSWHCLNNEFAGELENQWFSEWCAKLCYHDFQYHTVETILHSGATDSAVDRGKLLRWIHLFLLILLKLKRSCLTEYLLRKIIFNLLSDNSSVIQVVFLHPSSSVYMCFVYLPRQNNYINIDTGYYIILTSLELSTCEEEIKL